MPETCFESQLIRLRLSSFLFARYGRIGLARKPRAPDADTWNDALSANGLDRFVWSTFDDEQVPRALGMRVSFLVGHGDLFEVAEWHTPYNIAISHWRFRPHDRWSQIWVPNAHEA